MEGSPAGVFRRTPHRTRQRRLCINLGVSLDQLGLVSQALEYYRQARSLAEKGGALFSVQQLERRIGQLTAAVEQRG